MPEAAIGQKRGRACPEAPCQLEGRSHSERGWAPLDSGSTVPSSPRSSVGRASHHDLRRGPGRHAARSDPGRDLLDQLLLDPLGKGVPLRRVDLLTK